MSRKLLAWLNTFPDKPVDLIRFEFLPADTAAMALSTIQAAYIVKKYILGGYQAEYQFKAIYRMKPGNSNDKRLKADELLNALGDWATSETPPDIGDGRRVKGLDRQGHRGRAEQADGLHRHLEGTHARGVA